MNDAIRKSIKVTLDEIVIRERAFIEQHGIDIRDEDEWQQLKDFVIRIEEKIKPKSEAAE